MIRGALAGAACLFAGALRAADFAAAREAAVRRFAALVRDQYHDAAGGRALADRIASRLASDGYSDIGTAGTLAAALMEDVAAVTPDPHFHVMEGMDHGAAPSIRPGQRSSRPDPAWLLAMRRNHFGVHGATILAGGIGRLDLTQFYGPFAEVTARIGAAMRVVADTRGLVIDLTRCIGGDPAGVAHACSYFFDREPFVVNRFHWRAGVEEFRTTRDLAGPGYGEKRPVVVAVARDTFSAAEEFAYNLQALRRATVAGERTAGGANHAEMLPLGAGLVVFIPLARAENPVTRDNWEGRGVEPDLAASSDEIVPAAHREARRRADAAVPD